MCMTWVSNSIQKNDQVYLVIDFLKSKKITFSSGHKPFKKALHIVTTVEKFTFCGLMSLFFFDFCKGRIYPTEVMHY